VFGTRVRNEVFGTSSVVPRPGHPRSAAPRHKSRSGSAASVRARNEVFGTSFKHLVQGPRIRSIHFSDFARSTRSHVRGAGPGVRDARVGDGAPGRCARGGTSRSMPVTIVLWRGVWRRLRALGARVPSVDRQSTRVAM